MKSWFEILLIYEVNSENVFHKFFFTKKVVRSWKFVSMVNHSSNKHQPQAFWRQFKLGHTWTYHL